MSRRFKDKKKEMKSKRVRKENIRNKFVSWFHVILFIIVILPFILGGYCLADFISNTGLFNIEKIIINGNKRLTEKDILEAIDFEKNGRIYDLDLNILKSKLKELTVIKSVEVARKLPNKLVIDVKERKSFARFYFREKMFEVDVDGVIINRIKKDEQRHLPLIKGIRNLRKKVVLGEILDSPRLLKALDILKTVFVSDVSKCFNIVKLDIGNIRQILLYTDKKVEIQIGHDGIKRKLDNLALLLSEKKKDLESAAYIDLRFGGVIIRKKRK